MAKTCKQTKTSSSSSDGSWFWKFCFFLFFEEIFFQNFDEKKTAAKIFFHLSNLITKIGYWSFFRRRMIRRDNIIIIIMYRLYEIFSGNFPCFNFPSRQINPMLMMMMINFFSKTKRTLAKRKKNCLESFFWKYRSIDKNFSKRLSEGSMFPSGKSKFKNGNKITIISFRCGQFSKNNFRISIFDVNKNYRN